MHIRNGLTLIVATMILAGAAPSGAQTLAELAKKADDQRKAAKGKVYTNKDVGDVPPASAAPQTNPDAAAKTDAAAAKTDPAAAKPASPATGTATTDAAADKSTPKDQAAWAERMKALRTKADRDAAFAAALQSQINGLTADFVNRDDPAQRSVIEQNRTKAVSELARVQKDIVADKKAIADAEEEARRAGVPAGWLR
jgi:hypothetical protein